ncbi:MAG: phenylalanine--tRNA ligase subunit beta [Clostridiales bacterium]|nr:phenylalanine--tRNA ligase subunit beta [Clostridiales bacterium]
MLVPLKWLNDFIKIDDLNPQYLADAMTMSGSKVEDVIETGKEISNVVTGKILKIEKHPNADRLIVCMVDTGKDVIQIVTGANNVKVGNIVPVALHGSTLPGNVKIKRGRLRGVESNGMMCSAKELGIEEKNAEHGILILPDSTKVGADIKEVLGLNGVIIDFEITPNRPDCLGIIGIAREAAVTLNRKLDIPEIKVKENSESIDDYININIEAKDLCKRYAARLIKNVRLGESPDWIKERLTEAGIRPINNIVDITNYVMIEYGQPLHAYDYNKISGRQIIVRRALDGEKLITLDGKERILKNSMIVIADGDKPLVVAGVMGGESSEVTEKTTAVLLESACFNGTSIRLASKALGFRTEASSRFEKGLDPNIVLDALNRAAELIAELGAGDVVSGIIDKYEDKLKPWTIDVSADRINRFLGTSISRNEMKDILTRLDIKVKDGEEMRLTIPTYRSDLELEVDIAEEIARIHGYNNIKSTMISGETMQGGRNKKQRIEDKIKEVLVGTGLYECISYSFASPSDFDKINIPKGSSLRNTVKILNPLSEDLSIMRTTMIASMLGVLSRNYSKKNENAGLFEIGKIYIPKDGEKLPDEKNMLVIGMYGDYDFYYLKGIVQLLLKSLGMDGYEFVRDNKNMTFHPGKTADILIYTKKGDSNAKKINAGIIGQIHPDITERYDLPDSTYLCQMDFDALLENCMIERFFKPIPKYPAVQRDLDLLVSRDTMASDIENIIREKGRGIVEDIKLFDVYEGKQIPEGKRSIAYSIIYRSKDRTLKDEEVNEIHAKIIREIESRLDAKLRL